MDFIPGKGNGIANFLPIKSAQVPSPADVAPEFNRDDSPVLPNTPV